jgi:hypothetical protein
MLLGGFCTMQERVADGLDAIHVDINGDHGVAAS